MKTQELNEKVQSMIAKGCKLPVEKIEAILLKGAKAAAKDHSKGFAARAAAETRDYSDCPSLEEINRIGSLNQRPSSMRKW